MEVVKSNFRIALDSFRKHVVNAKYCAIDLEMTGITISGDSLNEIDTPQQRYTKMRAVAMKYNMIQIGLCLVEEPSPRDVVLRPYNVYVFPQSRKNYDPVLQLSTSAIEFNRDHNMDWNKWVREGVSYMTRDEEDKLRTELQEESLADLNNFIPKDYGVTRASDLEFIQTNLEKIMEWYNQAQIDFARRQTAEKTEEASTPIEYVLPDCNSYLRGALLSTAYCKMLGVTVQQYLAGKAREEEEALALVAGALSADTAATVTPSPTNNDTNAETVPTPTELRASLPFSIRVAIRGSSYSGNGVLMLMNAEEEAKYLADRQAQREERELTMCGVRKMWQLLKDNNVAFIGHNCYYDLLFLFHYLEAPLPESFEEFRKLCNEFFPNVYDTKLIYSNAEAASHANFVPSARTHLGNLFEIHRTALEEQAKPLSDASAAQTEDAAEPASIPETTAITGNGDSDVKTPVCTITTPEGFDDYTNTAAEGVHRYHEAGYDAYCTAYVFSYLNHGLGDIAKKMCGSVYSLYSFTATCLLPGVPVTQFPRLENGRDKDLFVVSNTGTNRPADVAVKCGVAASEIKYMDGEQFLVTLPKGAYIDGDETKGLKKSKFLELTQKNNITVTNWEDVVMRSDDEVAAAVTAAKESKMKRFRDYNADKQSANDAKKTRTENVNKEEGSQKMTTLGLTTLAMIGGSVIGAFGSALWRRIRGTQ